MKVRKYKNTDLDAILAAWENTSILAHPFLDEAFLVQERKNIPEIHLPNADTWVVEIDNLVVGFVSLIANEVGALFVEPGCHGCGAGRALMYKAQELHGELEVEVFTENSIGRKFYSRYGFSFVEEKLHQASGHQVLRLKYS